MASEFKNLTLGVIGSKHLWGDPEGIKTEGGFGRQMEELSRYFKRTILVVPFEQRPSPQAGYLIHIEGLEIVPLPYHSGAGMRGKISFIPKIPQIIRQIWGAYRRCDVLAYWMSGYIGTLGLLVHKLRRSKPGFTCVGTDWPERIRQSGDTRPRRCMASLVERLLPWLFQNVPTFAVGNLSQKYAHFHPYVHPDTQTVLSASDLIESREIGFSPPARLLFVGRLAVEKGLSYLLEALSQCVQRGFDLRLTLVGEGSERESLEKLARARGLGGRVDFKGFVPLGEALWQEYRQADIFILPSLSEGMPKVLIEAMASGLVVIASDVGGIPTLVQDGVNGLLVEPRSPEAIAAALQRLLQEPALRQRLAHNALATAREYTIEEQARRLIAQLAQDFHALGWN
jgi:glycosyltransferase involved in cell wall biosynthesis